MAKILDGKTAQQAIATKLKAEIEKGGERPNLAIIQIGDRSESTAYIKHKKKFADEIGAMVSHVLFPEDVSEREVLERIETLNKDEKTNGIILQLPVPPSLDKNVLIAAIDPKKDVDGLTPQSMEKLLRGEKDGFVPATPKGILALLQHYDVNVEGKHVVVVGRSMLVGRPAALLFLAANATVTVAHRKTERLPDVTKQADILIVAIGDPTFIGKEHVREGQIVVDVGVNEAGKKLEEEIVGRKLVGDVDFEAVQSVVSAISPVPGGVGPMTVASLFENLLRAWKLQRSM